MVAYAYEVPNTRHSHTPRIENNILNGGNTQMGTNVCHIGKMATINVMSSLIAKTMSLRLHCPQDTSNLRRSVVRPTWMVPWTTLLHYQVELSVMMRTTAQLLANLLGHEHGKPHKMSQEHTLQLQQLWILTSMDHPRKRPQRRESHPKCDSRRRGTG